MSRLPVQPHPNRYADGEADQRADNQPYEATNIWQFSLIPGPCARKERKADTYSDDQAEYQACT